jgi:two-component system NtrC family sensor kinase
MNGKVLVVDDNAEICTLLGMYILEPMGLQWATASDGIQGLEMALQYQPDLILLDINMPRMGGIEMLRALRETVCTAPVILITADSNLSVAVDAFRLGMKDYIAKPFTHEEAAAAIHRVLEQTRLQEEKAKLAQQLIAAEAVRQTTVTLAHRINNALMVIGGSLHLLQEIADQEHYSDNTQQLIRTGLQNARKIARVLESLQNTVNVQSVSYTGNTTMLKTEDDEQDFRVVV